MSHSLPIVITSGEQWVDIDAFACAVAYAELLQLQGKEAIVVIPGELNATIPDDMRALGTFQKTAPEKYSDVVIVDVSNPAHFAKFVKDGEVSDVFDHHSGHETYWQEKLGDRSRIEMIGACATLIYEAWEQAGKTSSMSENSARLLAAAIASNTLNFQIAITCERDHHAFAQSLYLGKVDTAWIDTYFASCDRTITTHLETSLRNDTKREEVPALGTVTIGQLELWKSGDLVRGEQELIEKALGTDGVWFLNAPSISERINYLLAKDDALKAALSTAVGVTWSGNVGTTPKLMLRKEILYALRAATR